MLMSNSEDSAQALADMFGVQLTPLAVMHAELLDKFQRLLDAADELADAVRYYLHDEIRVEDLDEALSNFYEIVG